MLPHIVLERVLGTSSWYYMFEVLTEIVEQYIYAFTPINQASWVTTATDQPIWMRAKRCGQRHDGRWYSPRVAKHGWGDACADGHTRTNIRSLWWLGKWLKSSAKHS